MLEPLILITVTIQNDAIKFFTKLNHLRNNVYILFSLYLIGAMCNVIPVKCKRVSTHTLMFWAGLGNVIFSFLCVPLPKIDLITLFHPYELGKCWL